MAVLRPLAGYVGLLCAAWAGCAAAAPSTGSTRADRLAEISHYRDQAQWVDALAAIQRAQLHEPDDDLLYKLQVLTLGDIGNAALAWRLYQARPQLFDSAQRDRLQANVLARQVGWSLAYGETEDTRLDEAESALQQLDQHAQAQGGASTRLRLDRLIVLNRLGLHAQVRDEARALQAQGVELPDYVLPVVADSMMATRHPDEALPLLQRAVRNDPSRLQARTELAYALLESEHAGQAIGYLQAWQQDEPAWRWGGGKAPYANWARYEADLNLAMVRAYSNDLPQAQQALEAMAAIGPGNSGLQSSLGSVYQMRGWPRRALQRHQIAHTLDPRNVPPRIGMVESWVQLQRDDLARPVHDDLLARYPNQPSVQRMDRDWRAHRGWQLQAGIEGGRSAGGGGSSPLGNDDLRWSLEAASPVLDDRWRLFAGAQRQSITFQSQDIAPLWLIGGVRYRFDRLDAEAALLHANDAVGRTGLRSSIGWQFNDRWHVGLSAAGNDPDASMQARIAGITADSIAIAADYQRNERTAWHLSVSQYRYDDGNRREAISSSLQQRLLSRPTLLIDGLASVYASRGSRDDAPYFNPSRDHSLELGLRIDQQLWQHYERHFRHRLEISLGDYWQQGHGDALVPRVAYRHEWQRAQGRVFEYGVSWSRPVYDGQRERHIGFDAAWRWGQ